MKKYHGLFVLLFLHLGVLAQTQVMHGEIYASLVNDNQLMVVMDSIESQDGSADYFLKIYLDDFDADLSDLYSPKGKIMMTEHEIELTFHGLGKKYLIADWDLKDQGLVSSDQLTMSGYAFTVFREEVGYQYRLMENYMESYPIIDPCESLNCASSGTLSCSVSCEITKSCTAVCKEGGVTACCKCLIVKLGNRHVAFPCCACVKPKES